MDNLDRNITLLGITAEIPEHPLTGQDKNTKNWFLTGGFAEPFLYVGGENSMPQHIAIFAAFCAAEWFRIHEEKGYSFEYEWKGIYQKAMNKMIKNPSTSQPTASPPPPSTDPSSCSEETFPSQ